MKNEHIIFGASIITATMYLLSNMTIQSMFDIVLWMGGGLALLVVPTMVYRLWKQWEVDHATGE